jgi:hypothetical protein
MPIAAHIKLWLINALSRLGMEPLSDWLMDWQWTWLGEVQFQETLEDGEYTYSYWDGRETLEG